MQLISGPKASLNSKQHERFRTPHDQKNSVLMIDPAHITSILHNHPNQVREIPFIPSDSELRCHIVENSLDRTPITIPNNSEELSREWKAKMKGVSMKKAHEITRLASYIHHLPQHIRRDYIVDVGSGQGYLHRVLSAKHILALDSDEHQTTGAEARERKVEVVRPHMETKLGAKVTHKTLDITPESLVAAVDDWVSSLPLNSMEERVPVLIVALHACGSLHIDALQAFIRANNGNQPRRWYFSSAVTVPCCYNLLRPNHFPLSSRGYDLLNESGLPHPLPASAYHLAAQGELEERNKEKWELGIRKVVWRALVGPILEEVVTSESFTPPMGIGMKEFIAPSEFTASKNATAPTPRRNLRTIAAPTFASAPASANAPDLTSLDGGEARLGSDTSGIGTSVLFQRLGKLPNAAYENWEVFMEHVEKRLYSTSPASNTAQQQKSQLHARLPRTHILYADTPPNPPESSRAAKLQQLHLARCSLGPVIETVILKDRKRWIQEQLSECTARWNVELVPLFDQKKGSARNMAVIVVPNPSCNDSSK
ncbi:hypothetical protein V5O48_002989 [Marasmius crinis-equi]|uniref:Methyltransferase domain-containing protein n=1 Tax=Marasmius crinis-equi TaxID=585013 RepID=A0ABR3FU36_9AGAR